MKSAMKQQIYKDAFRYIWLPICLSVFQACLEGVMSVRYASIFGNFSDAVFALNFAEGLKNIYSFLAVFLVTVLFIPALSFVNDMILVKNAFAHDRKVLGRFLDKSCEAVSQIEAGDMLNRLDEDPNELRQMLIMISSSALMIPVTLVYLIDSVRPISLAYFLMVLAISLVKFFVPMLVKKAEKKYHKAEKKYHSMVRSCETDIAHRAHLINLFGLGEPFCNHLNKLYDAFFQTTKKKSIHLNTTVESIQSFVDTLCMMMVLLIGAYFAAVNKISPGAVAAMVGYYSVLNNMIRKLDYIIRKVPVLDTLAERLAYFYEDREMTTGISMKEFQVLQGENLTVSRKDKVVFDSVSFSVQSGDKVAVCGENGSGKSTIMKVMLGLLGDYQGKLEVNGIRLSDVNLEAYRSLVAYAPQDPYLFKGTVMENIKLAKFDAGETEIKRWLQEYGIQGIAEREINSGGYELSGGERQKLSMIRAIIKDTPIVFMDEPENNLDAAAVEKVKEWILSSGRTIVYISHNPELIACANKRIEL